MFKRLLLVGLVAVGGVAATAVTSGAVTSSPKVTVTLNEFNVIPSVQGAPAGRVTFTVKNTGRVAHELVVIKTEKPAGSLLKGAKADEKGRVGEVANIRPGTTKRLTVRLAKGHYALLCNVPGHYPAGQYIDFYVR